MLYILLPVHNRKKITQKFIQCLESQTCQDFQLILIDDGSVDDTDKMVLNHFPNTRVIRGDGNLWWAGALQKGYEYIQNQRIKENDVVLLINDDTEFKDDFLEKALNVLQNSRKMLLKAWSVDKCTKIRGDGYIFADIRKMRFYNTNNQTLANCASTRGLFMKAKDFIDIGGFMPNKLPHYLSDYEFTIRACNKSYKIYCDDGLELISDSNESGYHIINYRTFGEFIGKFFSIKCPVNPKYLINFVQLM